MKDFMSIVVAATSIASAGAETQHWTPEEIMKTKIITDIQISPNNQSVLFVVTEAKITDDKSEMLSRIYKSNTKDNTSARLFSAPNVSSSQPRWSPDGKWIAFLSTRDGTKNLYLIPSDGGEASAITQGTKGVQTYAWAPDSKQIAFVRCDETEDEKKKTKTSSAYVYKERKQVNRLWLLDPFSPESTPRALTNDDYCVRGLGDFGTINTEFDWSPDGKAIVFSYTPALGFDHYHCEGSLAMVEVATGQVTPWEKSDLYEALPRFSPDGKWIAYVKGTPSGRFAFNNEVAIRSAEGEDALPLAQTYNGGSFLSGPNLLGWTKDGRHVMFFEPKGTKFHLVLLARDGSSAKELDTGDCFFQEPMISNDRSMIGFVSQSPSKPPEIYIASLSSFQPVQVSDLNSQFLSKPSIKTEVINWESKDKLKIEGLITYPVNYQEGHAYPLLVVIHGGPMGFFEESFVGKPYPYPIASFAEAGFVILRPNPRGSCGYGRTFRGANYLDWGGMDFADIMSGVDDVIARGIADPDRMGVMGWSYGGYMTAWAITQTSRFKAASTGAGLSNLASMAGTTDVHRFMIGYLGDFITDSRLYAERSPVNHVLNVTTPCLIQHGTDDKRVPASQAYEFYHALDRHGKKPVLILYPGMEHRITDAKMSLDAMKSNLDWFTQHVLYHAQQTLKK